MVNTNDATAAAFRRCRGFTLFELVLLIALLGMIVVVALPRFIDMPDLSEEAERDAVVGAVRAGIAMYSAQRGVRGDAQESGASPWPELLDDNDDGPCVACFSHVLRHGINDSRWTRSEDGLVYTFTPAGGKHFSYAYDPARGIFDVLKIEPVETKTPQEMMEPEDLLEREGDEDASDAHKENIDE